MPGDGIPALPNYKAVSVTPTHLYRHDAGQDGDGDADGTAVADKLEEDRRLEEQLSDNEVCTGVDLLPQVNQVIIIAWAAGVSRWVACYMAQ